MTTVAVSEGDVILIVTLVALPIALIAFLGAGKALEQLGKGGLALDRDSVDEAEASPMERRAIRDSELRQMLEAKSYRREQRGEDPLDVEAELRALTGPPAAGPGPGSRSVPRRPVSLPEVRNDPGLREEIRALVIASNARRARRGQEPLDVEAEVERQLAELADLQGS